MSVAIGGSSAEEQGIIVEIQLSSERGYAEPSPEPFYLHWTDIGTSFSSIELAYSAE